MEQWIATKQIGGTCWFHSIFNGFLLSPYCRAILKESTKNYIDTRLTTRSKLLEFGNQTYSCPRLGHLYSRFNFYKWLYRVMFVPSTNVHQRSPVLNLLPNRRNIGIHQGAWPSEYIIKIMSRLGIQNYEYYDPHRELLHQSVGRPYFAVIGSRTFVPFNITLIPSLFRQFKLDHCSIYVNFDRENFHGAHAIAGVIASNGKYYIVDSNIDEAVECDWTNPQNVKNSPRYRELVRETYNGSSITNAQLNYVLYVDPGIKTNARFNISPNNLSKRLPHLPNRINNSNSNSSRNRINNSNSNSSRNMNWN